MLIRYGEKSDFQELRKFYNIMCAVLGKKDFLPEGNKGGFPSDQMILDAITQCNLFVGIESNQIMAAYIMNHECDMAYHSVSWFVEANNEEVSILHALRVLPEYSGRGYSKQLVRHAIETARKRKQKAIRLDCIEGNDIPQKIYMSLGFQYVDTIKITYEDIGGPRRFHLYELVL